MRVVFTEDLFTLHSGFGVAACMIGSAAHYNPCCAVFRYPHEDENTLEREGGRCFFTTSQLIRESGCCVASSNHEDEERHVVDGRWGHVESLRQYDNR